MWKGIVGDCSTVWIVTEINRAASDKAAWGILESVSSLIGNGGECQQIHFICTKSDLVDDSDDLSSADIHDRIVKRNIQAKDGVRKEFNKRSKINKHFTDDSFKVFTVSSKEFLKGKHLSPEETGGSFNGVISRFLLNTNSLIQKYQDVKLQLIFLQTEEDKIKAKLNKIILKGKKIIYNSLTETIEKNMKKCYEDAQKISGKDGLKKMRKTIETHVSLNRNIYEDAKKTMMTKMNILMVCQIITYNETK
ncbi:unnamed protein product [Oreochromis niloticus]|nr:unnamed protein product [Mustela putorius furo]